jgi:dsDNA-binding SOS-regulon protein
MSELKQVYQAEDGSTFNTKKEAEDHMRLPKVHSALMALTEANQELSDWLLGNKDNLVDVFGTGTVKRVTKAERNKLKKGLDAVVEAHTGEPKYAFLVENAAEIAKSFKWPGQKRLVGEEKDAAIKESLIELVGEDNTKLADWIVAEREKVEECFEAGKPKREVSQAAIDGLKKYQDEQKAKKAAAEAE